MSKKYIFIITLIFISKTLQQCNGLSVDDCKAYPLSDLYGDKCCYYTKETYSSPNSPNSHCRKIPYSASIKFSTGKTLEYDVIDGDLYKVDCGSQTYADQSVRNIVVM